MVRTLKIGLLTLIAGWTTGGAAETLRVYLPVAEYPMRKRGDG